MKRLALVVPVALVITLGLLFNAFRSLSLAAADAAQRALRADGRRRSGCASLGMPMSVAAAVGLHRADRAGVAQRRARAVGHRRAARRQASACGRGDRRRAAQQRLRAGADDRGAGGARAGAGGDQPRPSAPRRSGPIAVVIVGGTLSAALLTLVRAAGHVSGVRQGDRAGAAQAAGVARAAGVRPGALTRSRQGTNAWTSA